MTQKLLHPTHAIPKQYMAIVQGQVEEDELKEKLSTGVETADGTAEGVHKGVIVGSDEEFFEGRVVGTKDTVEEEERVGKARKQTVAPQRKNTKSRLEKSN